MPISETPSHYRISLPDVRGLDGVAAAVAYAKAGFWVLLVEAFGWDELRRKWSKRPHRRWLRKYFPNVPKGQGGFKLASNDPEIVREWFTRFPDALIGLWPGPSGVCVLDLDGSDGISDFYRLATPDFDALSTAAVRTPGDGGGRHVYFDISHIDARTGNGSLHGLHGETRGHGGYVIVPGRPFPPAPDGTVMVYANVTDDDDQPVLGVAQMPSWVEPLLDWGGGDDDTPLAEMSRSEVEAWINSLTVAEADEHPRAVEAREAALDDLSHCVPGDNIAGRHPTLLKQGGRLSNYISMGWLDGPRTIRMLQEAFLKVKPDGRSEFDESISFVVAKRVGESRGMGFNAGPGESYVDPHAYAGKDPTSLLTQPHKYLDEKNGLKVDTLEAAILRTVDVALAPGRTLNVYKVGVWRPGGDDAVSAQVRRALGEKFRTAHAATMVEAIKVLPPAVIDPQVAVTEFINCRNGLLDWRTGELHPHDPSVPSLNQIPHEWDLTAECPRFDRFLIEVLVPNGATISEHASTIRAAWQLLGAILYDGNPWQKAALLRGPGENGKGVYIGAAKGLVGPENVATIDLHTVAENRFATAELFGKMANLAGDLDPKMIKQTAKFKMLTGGDSVPAERKFQQPFHFVCRAFSIFSANETLLTADTSHGYYRRWLIIPFPNTFPPERRDPSLTLDLMDEMPGILVKAVAGLRDLMDSGSFVVSKAMKNADADERRHSNPVRAFVSDRIELGDDRRDWITRNDLYATFKIWCESEGLYPLSARTFHGRFRQALLDEIPEVIEIGDGPESQSPIFENKVAGIRRYQGTKWGSS